MINATGATILPPQRSWAALRYCGRFSKNRGNGKSAAVKLSGEWLSPAPLNFYHTYRHAATSQVLSGISGNSAAIATAVAAYFHVAVGFGRQGGKAAVFLEIESIFFCHH